MVKKFRRTEIEKGLIGGGFFNFSRRYRQALLVISVQLAGPFTLIWLWACLKLNFE